MHRPRTSRGAPSRQALLHAATLRSAQIARSWLIPCRRPLRPQPIPDQAAIERAEAFTRERFVHDGEDPAVALAPGSGRRRALDDALREIDAGAKVPSTQMAPALRAAARPRARAQRGRAAPGRRRAAEPPPGRRALGHADRAAGRRPERPRRSPRPAAEPVLAVDDEPEPETPAAAAPDEPDETTSPSSTPTRTTTRTTTTSRRSRPPPTRTTRTTTRTTTSRSRRARTTRTTSPRTSGRTTPSPTSTRTSRRAPPTTPTPTSASGSSTRPAPARPSPRWASSRPRAPAAS